MESTTNVMPIVDRPEIEFVAGKGDYLYDSNDKAYIDWVQGWAVNGLGHCHPAMTSAIANQADRLINCSPAFHSRKMSSLASKLASLSGMDYVFFANSGAEANEGAIKLARKWGQQNKEGAFEIITFVNGFHGRTLTTMAASGKSGWGDKFEPKTPGFHHATYNDINSVERLISSRTVGVMLELIQGEAGVVEAQYEFVNELVALCRQHGILLIVDEIQTGVYRTGTALCCEHYGIAPDIITLGKGLGGGVPVSALLTNKAIMCFEPGDQGGTFNGNPLAMAAAELVIDVMNTDDFKHQLSERSQQFESELSRLQKLFTLGNISGKGMLWAIELNRPIGAKVVQTAFDLGLLINNPRADKLRFMPALNLSESAMKKGFDLLEQALRSAIEV
ncbi:aminotransferase class III-fold pyridoxal phosphate-dependent enzyme [Enterovibrio coralii]|uniref:Acetylornithine aminotransferase n=1 Tax=Enterovibrio coralii TaxID=294935 RepID=A0A135I507_9GAMM|nr:aminotransferase class III-fold pyridoxal phosphate-dependent enzyme [Enterovibrio coralii]KXF80539.1 acetylornithine aminotransferase [Enterovibrio coralii]